MKTNWNPTKEQLVYIDKLIALSEARKRLKLKNKKYINDKILPSTGFTDNSSYINSNIILR